MNTAPNTPNLAPSADPSVLDVTAEVIHPPVDRSVVLAKQSIPPNRTAQFFHQTTREGDLVGVTIQGQGRIQRVMAGTEQIVLEPSEVWTERVARTLEDGRKGIRVEAQSFVTVILKNDDVVPTEGGVTLIFANEREVVGGTSGAPRAPGAGGAGGGGARGPVRSAGSAGGRDPREVPHANPRRMPGGQSVANAPRRAPLPPKKEAATRQRKVTETGAIPRGRLQSPHGPPIRKGPSLAIARAPTMTAEAALTAAVEPFLEPRTSDTTVAIRLYPLVLRRLKAFAQGKPMFVAADIPIVLRALRTNGPFGEVHGSGLVEIHVDAAVRDRLESLLRRGGKVTTDDRAHLLPAFDAATVLP